MTFQPPKDWPAPGLQDDGSIVEYIFTRLGYSYATHRNYMSYVLKRKGCNKERLYARAWIGTGLGCITAEADEFEDWMDLPFHSNASFEHLHALYDQWLAPEHRSKYPPHLTIPKTWKGILAQPWCLDVDNKVVDGDSVAVYVKPEWLPKDHSTACYGNNLKDLLALFESEFASDLAPPKGWPVDPT